MIKNIIAVYPGRFNPFALHHYTAFRWLQKQFGDNNCYIVTSNKVDPPKSPLNFEEKKQIISKYKLSNRLIEVKDPYKAVELMSKFNPKDTAVVFMVGEKDMKEDPRFSMKPKKDGNPSYFQSYKKNKDNLEGFDKHGYLIVAPNVSLDIPGYGEMSGTAVRTALSSVEDAEQYKTLFKQIFGWYDSKIASMIKEKFSQSNIKESILKHITNSILLKEGGNIFKSKSGESLTGRINKKDVEPTVKWLEKITGLSLLDNMLGSTGKKDTSGDLDIAINDKKITKDQLIGKLISYGLDKSNIKKSGDSVHLKTPINGDEKNGFVQTDFMFGDPEWMKFAMLGGAEGSEYKGVHRKLLLVSIAKSLGYKWSNKGGLMNRQTDKTITKDPNKIAKILLGKEKKEEDLQSVESILKSIRGRKDHDSLIQYAKEDFKKYNTEFPTIKESIINENPESRIQHPEDLIFWDGSKGAINALSILSNLGKTTEDVSVKWDGSPAVVFGRKEDGTFVLTDKSGFSAKGYDGKATSGKDLENMFMNRLKGKEDKDGKYFNFAKSMGKIFNYFEKSTPKDIRGYFNGDLLYQQKPKIEKGNYVFKPNVTTYKIPKNSELGNKIENSNVGVVIHSFMDYEGSKKPIKDISQYKFDNSNGLLVFPPTVVSSKPNINTSLIKSTISKIKSKSKEIDSFLNKSVLSTNKISNLPDLMYKYNNSKVGNTKDLGKDFLDFISKQSIPEFKKSSIENYIKNNESSLMVIFSIISDIINIKNDIVKQFDSQDSEVKANIGDIPGGEGYVVSSPKGTVKLVNRTGFTAANRAVKR